ncbi:MAG: hypothetical protein ACLUNO_11965 [Oscillospiraceae bacterium]
MFDAQRGITAGEAAVMLSSFLEPSPPPRSTSDDIPDWAYAAVSSLTSCGVFPDGADDRRTHHARRGCADAAGRV